MHLVASSEKDTATATLEKRLWDAADQFRANSGLKSQEYSAPVLGLIFLRFAEVRFAAQRGKLEQDGASSRRGSRVDDPTAYHAEGILYLPADARFDYLLNRSCGTSRSTTRATRHPAVRGARLAPSIGVGGDLRRDRNLAAGDEGRGGFGVAAARGACTT